MPFLMLCKSMLTHEVMVWWWKSVFHVSYVFYVIYVFPMVYVMLVSCYALWLKGETWGMYCMEGNMFMCLKSCYMSLETWDVKEMNEQVKTMYVSSLRKRKEKRTMRSNRREHGVLWTFLLNSQPLFEFILLLLNYEFFIFSFHTMVKLGN